MRATGSSDPAVKKKLFQAVRRVLLCLDPLTDLLLTHDGAGDNDDNDDDPQLRLLQQEVTVHDATQTHSYSITNIVKSAGSVKPNCFTETN